VAETLGWQLTVLCLLRTV